jgi:hypothetical protein
MSGGLRATTRLRTYGRPGVNADEMVTAIKARSVPYAEVQVCVAGLLIDVADVEFDRVRHVLVIRPATADTEDAMRRFLRAEIAS